MGNKGKLKLSMISLVVVCFFVTVGFYFSPPVHASYSSDIFFSEYVEGSSYNKALEIYNGTQSSVNMSQYSIVIYFNGSTSAGSTISLSGTLASGSCYVIAHSSAGTAVKNKANLTSSGLSFNGNDAVVLKKGAATLDVVGQVGNNPGTEWGTGYTSTCDNTLVRKNSIMTGDTNSSDSFTPSAEWNGYQSDTFSYLGTHTSNWYGGTTPTPTTSASSTPTATPTPTSTLTATPTPIPSGAIYNCYFGQMHSHTSYSDGQLTPGAAFAYARNTGGADFMAVTDHSNSFDNSTNWANSTEWANLKSAAATNTVDGQFIAIAGFEMTWSNGTGHMNTFNTDWFESRNNSSMTLANYYNRIASDSQSFSQWNHPGTTFGDFNSFSNYSAANDAAITLIEVANGSGPVGGSGYYPSYDYYWEALDQGWHVAPTIGQDNHSADWITANEARTVALAASLTKNNIFDAFKNRRVYATEDRNLHVSYKANGAPMGSILSQPSTLNAEISVSDPNTSDIISEIEILSSGGVVMYSNTFSSNNVNWNLSLDPTEKYYYLKITQTDGNLAFSAPIWTGR